LAAMRRERSRESSVEREEKIVKECRIVRHKRATK